MKTPRRAPAAAKPRRYKYSIKSKEYGGVVLRHPYAEMCRNAGVSTGALSSFPLLFPRVDGKCSKGGPAIHHERFYLAAEAAWPHLIPTYKKREEVAVRPLPSALIFLASVFLSPLTAAYADEWLPPTPQTYVAANGAVRLRVTPRAIGSPLSYFDDKVKGHEPAGQASVGARHAEGALERRGAGKQWTSIWARPLVNDVAPADALVAEDGRYVVTFDDWFVVGLGDHVVAIYGADGTPIRSLKLTDILPPDYISGLTRSVSSLWWGKGGGFTSDGSRLVLKVAIPSNEPFGSDASVDVFIDLATGAVVPPSGPAWEAAYAKARLVAADKARGEVEQRAFFANPLLGPKTTSEPDWHQYLREAYWRLDPDWKDGSTSTTVLRAPDAKDYRPSEKWVRDALMQRDGLGSAIAIASPASPENLLSVMAKVMPQVRAGSLKGIAVYIAAPASYRERIASLLASSGARFVFLDPTIPIPQRPERLRQ